VSHRLRQRQREAERWLRDRAGDDARLPANIFDLERALARHRALVGRGTGLPEWAERELPASTLPRMPRVARWLLLSSVVALVAWLLAPLRSPGGPRPGEPKPRDAAEHPRPPERVGRESAPIVYQLDMAPRALLDAPPPVDPPIAASLASDELTPERVERRAQASADPGSAVQPRMTREPTPREAATTLQPMAGAPGAHRAARSTYGDHRLAARERPQRARAEMPSAQPLHPPGAREAQDLHAQGPLDALEMRELARAEQLLESDPDEALSLVRDGERHFPHGYFRQERRYLEVMALLALERPAEARAQAWAFLQDYRRGPYAKKIERLLEQLP
jgi:hypothetical protein